MKKIIFIGILLINCFDSLNGNNLNIRIHDQVDDPSLVEGDIKLDMEKSLGYRENFRIWENGRVPYLIDTNLTSVVAQIKKAMNMIETKTQECIKFVPKSSIHSNWIRITKLKGCYSYLGNLNKGEQIVSLGNGCYATGTIVHELCHALGFHHEQNRPDRDEYVTIRFENIKDGKSSNFNKYTGSYGNYYGTPYDYGSIMHYDDKAFSKNGQQTIIPKKAGVNLLQSYEKTDAQILTGYDVQAMRKRYQCSGTPVQPTCIDKSFCRFYSSNVFLSVFCNMSAFQTHCPNLCKSCN